MTVAPIPIIIAALVALSLSACNTHKEEVRRDDHKIVATHPQVRAVTISEPYVCQIHSHRHIRVRVLERGYLEAISVKEGQAVKAGDVLFKVIPLIYKSKLDAQLAEQQVAQMEFNFGKKLLDENVISKNEVSLLDAKLERTKANAQVAAAELNFATVKAAFDGIIDRLHHQQGALVAEGDILTTLSDNSLMWVYFNVPEARYLEYMENLKQHADDLKIELRLANRKKFNQTGKIGAIEAERCPHYSPTGDV